MKWRGGLSALAYLTLCLLGFGCDAPRARSTEAEAGPPSSFFVLGIDGGEWSVIRQLWSEGKLPYLRELAERGVAVELKTNYTASPVIWTTIATGMRPKDHGITDFVVPTPSGDVPVSSTVRRAPAIWNMLSHARRKVAVLGWWASWPAEEIRGVVVSDRASLKVPNTVSPESYLPTFQREAEEAKGLESPFWGNSATRQQDHLIARVAQRVVTEDYDLVLAYLRSVDISSHNHWKHFRPEDFPADSPDVEEVARFRDRIPDDYEAVDEVLGKILEAADSNLNVLVISDHGFRPAKEEIVQVFLDFDAVLERLGYLKRTPEGDIDFARSQMYTYASADFRRAKQIRLSLAGREPGGHLRPADSIALRRRLAEDLARVTYATGQPAFGIRDARPREARAGVEFVVRVELAGATQDLWLDGLADPLGGVIQQVSRVSGTHTASTHGILLGAGPDIQQGAQIDGISIHDITPTLLYGLGLPTAKNFAGRPFTELFTEELRSRSPLREIPAWNIPSGGGGRVTESAVDEEMVRELRALGYLQ